MHEKMRVLAFMSSALMWFAGLLIVWCVWIVANSFMDGYIGDVCWDDGKRIELFVSQSDTMKMALKIIIAIGITFFIEPLLYTIYFSSRTLLNSSKTVLGAIVGKLLLLRSILYLLSAILCLFGADMSDSTTVLGLVFLQILAGLLTFRSSTLYKKYFRSLKTDTPQYGAGKVAVIFNQFTFLIVVGISIIIYNNYVVPTVFFNDPEVTIFALVYAGLHLFVIPYYFTRFSKKESIGTQPKETPKPHQPSDFVNYDDGDDAVWVK